ncbi:hypothetical protein [Trichothermofontia sp.]
MVLAIGDRVRIHCPGSQRHGKTGTIQQFKTLHGPDGQTLSLADVQVAGEVGLFEAQLGWLQGLPARSNDRRLQPLAKVRDRV